MNLDESNQLEFGVIFCTKTVTTIFFILNLKLERELTIGDN